MYCLGCKDFTHNFGSQEVKMTNKVLREKSNRIVCWSSKSRFLRQNSTIKNKNMHAYCKNYKKHTCNTFPKN